MENQNERVTTELKGLELAIDAPDWVMESLQDSRFIAKGSYCKVFAGTAPDKVVKISHSKADLNALEVLAGTSHHYPATYRRFDNAAMLDGSKCHAIELERVLLAPDSKIRTLTDFLYRRKEHNRLFSLMEAAYLIQTEERFGAEYPKSLGAALHLLAEYVLTNHGPSVKPDLYTTINWGIRGDGELVIIDPMNYPPPEFKAQ